jgi:tetratricopeptide (TPR) repeat protein
LNAQGKRAEAKEVQLEALARMQEIMGADAYHLTFVLRALAETYDASGEPEQSVLVLRRALDLSAKKYPPTHGVVLQYRVGLAAALLEAGDTDAALAEAEAVLAASAREAELTQYAARAALTKGRILNRRGDRDAAIALARQGLADLDRGNIDHAPTRRGLVALSTGQP